MSARGWVLALALGVGACNGVSVVGGPLPDAQTRDVVEAGADIVDVPVTMDAVDVPLDAPPARCTGDADCPGQVCDTSSGRCVACLPTNDRCPADQHCDGATNACVPGCRIDEGCRAATVDGGVSGPSQRCHVVRHTCVDCVTDDHCPAGNLCVGNVCVTGCTADRPCATGQTCCAGACVETDSNAAHCGACGNNCALPGATPGCNNGRCVVGTCSDGRGDCDREPTNGCETDLRTAVAHCGACGMQCPARPNTASSCDTGRCAYACSAGFADCDGDPANGCEADTRASVSSCGACGRSCAAPNGTPSCAMGACVVSACDQGFGDCDGAASNGCETDLRGSTGHCGACGRACPARTNTLATCQASRCLYGCALGFGDCDGDALNGCEVDLGASELHCGACGRSCVTANVATARCAAARCAVVACAAGFADCDGDPANGCEVDTRASNAHCGACGSACAPGTACSGGTCRSTCATGETFCAGRCVDTRSAATDCGSCGNACAAGANATATCVASTCGLRCAAGFGNCDGNLANGCEVDTRTSPSHCNACGVACPTRANATATCAAGACGIACVTGFADCDGAATNGCEVDTRGDAANCGACGARCALPGATTSVCASGACRVGTCATGRGDCDAMPTNGCEVDLLSSASHCGACGRACGSGQACQAGVCTAFPSTGADGVFDPAVNTVLPSGVYNFRSIRVRAGVTVTTSGTGVLDLRSQGDIEVAGTIDLSGGRGGDGTQCNGAASGGGASGTNINGISNDLRPDNAGSPGGAGGVGPAGADGRSASVACRGTGGAHGGGGGGGWPAASGSPGCGSGGGGGAAGGGGGGGGMCCTPSTYGGRALYSGGDGGGANGGAGGAPSAAGNGGAGSGAPYDGANGAPAGCGGNGEGGGGGGSVGVAAAMDLSVASTFQPGSGGGGGGGGHGMGGGGGGGALRLATTTTLTISGRALANGGRGGDGTPSCCGAGGGGGSGGVIVLSAPTLRVTGTVSTAGGAGGVASAPYGGAGGAGGLGRVAVRARAGSCTLGGTFNPPLVSGCAVTPGEGTRGRVHVAEHP